MTAPSSLPLLVEIGCEEIPARFLSQAQKDFSDRLKSGLEEYRLFPREGKLPALSPGERVAGGSETGEGGHQEKIQVHSYSTPRRLVAHVPAILERQPDKTEEIMGPPVKVAVDAQGKYTRAAESFARKNSVELKDLIRVTTPKGEHLAVKKTALGRPAIEVLSEILPGVITGISFPKSMVWAGKSGPRFVRPIRWILALLGEIPGQVVPFEIAGVKSGDFTFGHRALGQEQIKVAGFADYVEKLRARHVELDQAKRLESIRSECKALLEGSGLRVVEDRDLEDWIVNSTEWPHGLLGSFDAKFLKLPCEILITVMRDHQKYFAVEDGEGKLQAKFVTLLNVAGDPKGIIRRGHERVLTARFSDAEFFWNADQKIPLRDRVPMLEKVTYQAKLGSYGDKVRRMEAIAKEIGSLLQGQGKITAKDEGHVLRAVKLCKCDLTTQMVQEFTELQGIVGGLYARAQREPPEVADAIYDHYLPEGAEDKCPRSAVGSVVSLADKLDSIVSWFDAGLEPTGSSDPFGLRRAGNGIVRLALISLPSLNVHEAVETVFHFTHAADEAGLQDRVATFLRGRVEFYLREVEKLPFDVTRAVLSGPLGWGLPADARLRGVALERVRNSDDFRALAHAAKRTRNILEQAEERKIDYKPGRSNLNMDLFSEKEERELFAAYESTLKTYGPFEAGQNYDLAFRELAKMRGPIDRFFDKVLVMVDDQARRANRLTLLNSIMHFTFSRLADLSEISPAESQTEVSTN